MNRKRSSGTIQALVALGVGAALMPRVACADDGYAIAIGSEYTTGTYGGDVAVDEVYVPFTVSTEWSRVGVSLTVPLLSVRAPALTVIDADGQPVVGDGPVSTESGLGDVVLTATLYDTLASADGRAALDLTGKVKFGTADVDAGLGTGEDDYTVQADLYRFFEGGTLMGTLGYTFRGSPPAIEIEDTFLASVGVAFDLRPGLSVGAFYDYRTSSYDGGSPLGEATVTLQAAIGPAVSLQGYVLAGFGDDSPDWGIGFGVTGRW